MTSESGPNRALEGLCAFITGGSGAIAEACAMALLRDGAKVSLVSRNLDALNATRDRLLQAVPDSDVLVQSGDCLDPETVRSAFARTRELHGQLDIIVATVGQGSLRPLLLHDLASFSEDWHKNVTSAFIAIRYGAPLLGRGGSIICISSVVAKRPARWMSAYATAKGGLENLVGAAAEELAPAGIRVNAVRPGLTRSKLRSHIFEDSAMMQTMLAQIPLGRAGEPIDTANAVRFLAGPESSWITGQSFAVDGGNELRKSPVLKDMVYGEFGNEVMDKIESGEISKYE